MSAPRLQIEHVLLPTDFSASSGTALQHAVAVARWFEARLTVLHVLPDPVAWAGVPEVPAPVLVAPAVQDQALKELAAFVAPAVEAAIPVEPLLRQGDAAQEIKRAADELAADLIVMATHGRSGLDRLLLGSVTEAVLRVAPCPVLTIGQHAERLDTGGAPFRRILCAADLSTSSDQTIGVAFSLAEEAEAHVSLLHVVEARLEGDDRVREQLRRVVPPEARAWCAVDERVVVGEAHREILRVASEEAADVIVMGTHGHGPIRQIFFGSTANQVVRGARCPVLSVRPPRVSKAHAVA